MFNYSEFTQNLRKCIAAETASIVGAGISAAASAGNTAAVARTNKRGERLTKWLNEQNRQLAKEQNDWNLMMWQNQNRYNDFSSIHDRMIKAGMNPLFYNMDGTSNASQISSADLANQSNQGFGYQTPQFDASGITQNVATYAQSKLQDKAIDVQLGELELNKERLEMDRPYVKAQTDKLLEEIKTEKSKRDEIASNIAHNDAQIEVLGATLQGILTDNKIKEEELKKVILENSYFKEQLELDLKQRFANLRLTNKQIEEIGYKIQEIVWNSALTSSEIDYNQIKTLAESIQSGILEGEKDWQNEEKWADIISKYVGAVGSIGSTIFNGAVAYKIFGGKALSSGRNSAGKFMPQSLMGNVNNLNKALQAGDKTAVVQAAKGIIKTAGVKKSTIFFKFLGKAGVLSVVGITADVLINLATAKAEKFDEDLKNGKYNPQSYGNPYFDDDETWTNTD